MRLGKSVAAVGITMALITGAAAPSFADGPTGHNEKQITAAKNSQKKLASAKKAAGKHPKDLKLKTAADVAFHDAVVAHNTAAKAIGKTFADAVKVAKDTFKASAKTAADKATKDAAIAAAATERDAALLALGPKPKRN